jgi:hypothetical protein
MEQPTLENIRVCEGVKLKDKKIKIECRTDIPFENVGKILDVTVFISCDNAKSENGRVTFNGKATFNLIYFNDGLKKTEIERDFVEVFEDELHDKDRRDAEQDVPDHAAQEEPHRQTHHISVCLRCACSGEAVTRHVPPDKECNIQRDGRQCLFLDLLVLFELCFDLMLHIAPSSLLSADFSAGPLWVPPAAAAHIKTVIFP